MKHGGLNPDGVVGGQQPRKLHYTLRVEPDDDQPFEAEIAIWPKDLKVAEWKLGPTVAVLYDPTDHSKVAFDYGAMIAANREARHEQLESARAAEQQTSAPESNIAQLKALADLRDRGALTDAEFAAEKAKLLDL